MRKRREDKEKYPGVINDDSSEMAEDFSIKRERKKKSKRKNTEDTSLGVVDTDLLRKVKGNLTLQTDLSQPEEDCDKPLPKKKKKMKKVKQQNVESNSTASMEKGRNERALEYLRLWNSDRKAWKFNKMLQVQLLNKMYDTSVVNDEDFSVLVLYLDNLRGKAKEKTMEGARKIIDREETGAADAEIEERARQICQILN